MIVYWLTNLQVVLTGRARGWGDWQVNAFPADALTCLGQLYCK
jgi:hypothetical protein